MSASPGVKEADRVPVPQKLAFSMGYSVDYMASGLTTGVLWMPFFNIGLGISPMVLGVLLMVLRGWDAITDPVMGNISDNTRTRWGRRRPYIGVGAVLTAGLYLCLWRLPEGMDLMGQYILLGGLGVVFFTCFTVWSVPYYSLQMELTPSYDERTRLAAWVAIVGKLVYLGGGWVLAFATCSLFDNPETGEADIVHGMRTTSWIIAGLIVVMGLLPTFFVRERYYAATVRSGHRTRLWESIRESFHCRPLWYLIGISFFMIIGSSINNTLGQYVSIYVLNDGKIDAASMLNGWRATGVMVIGILGIPCWAWLSERLDKKIIVTIMLGGSVVGHMLNLFCLRPDMPYLWLVSSVFEAGALGAVWMFFPSMKADVADYDEIDTHTRREGSLNAFYSWFAKVAGTAGAGLGGFVLQMSGFDALLGEQSPEVLTRMKWLYICLPLVLWSFTLLFIWRYPLDRGRMKSIRNELEARRGSV
jgi:GPH family glycoside/pentoside/hexuronide:cation symporter